MPKHRELGSGGQNIAWPILALFVELMYEDFKGYSSKTTIYMVPLIDPNHVLILLRHNSLPSLAISLPLAKSTILS